MKPSLALAAFLLAAPASAAPDAEAPRAPAESASAVKERYVSAVKAADRAKALEDLAKTAPTSGSDVTGLFDLFSRFPDAEVRKAVMDSLALIPKDSPQIEPIFLTYLRQPEPEAQLFGINGAFRLRSSSALPLVRAIAERKFVAASAAETTVLSERNAWWTQYEALSALAQWEGEKALPLLRKRAQESPLVARLLGRFFWKQTLPELPKWAAADDVESRERARQAAASPIEPADARATREAMLSIVRDPLAESELRHQLALKAGAISTEAEAAALAAEHDAASDPKTKLLLAAALFASRRDAAVPLLARYARESPDESFKSGAFAQLVDMLGEEAAKARVQGGK